MLKAWCHLIAHWIRQGNGWGLGVALLFLFILTFQLWSVYTKGGERNILAQPVSDFRLFVALLVGGLISGLPFWRWHAQLSRECSVLSVTRFSRWVSVIVFMLSTIQLSASGISFLFPSAAELVRKIPYWFIRVILVNPTPLMWFPFWFSFYLLKCAK